MKIQVFWSKLRIHVGLHGKEGKEEVNGSISNSCVTKEYKQAFRTRSYIEMCNKVQGQLDTRTSLDGQYSAYSSPTSSSSSSSLPFHSYSRNVNLSEYLLEPRQETLISISGRARLPQSIINYFEISSEAGMICESLLKNVHKVRGNYHYIKNKLKFLNRVPSGSNQKNNQNSTMYSKLASFTLHDNDPFSPMSKEKFYELHHEQVVLFQKLTSQVQKAKRRTKIIRRMKQFGTSFVIVGCAAFSIALLVLAIHSMVGIVAAPGLLVFTLGLFSTKKLKKSKGKFIENSIGGLSEQLDIAARGVYILINNFDTMSRIVQRVNDELEHRKFAVDICVRKGKIEMLKEVVKEIEVNDSWFLEQLEELERQIYLCFLDINRSRRLIVEELAKC